MNSVELTIVFGRRSAPKRAALDGVTRTSKARFRTRRGPGEDSGPKSQPSTSRGRILVFSSLKARPLGASHSARACLLIPWGVHQRGDEGECSEVDGGVFVVAAGDGSPLFEASDAPFDGVPLCVQLGVESRWSAVCRSLGFTAFLLIGPFGNGVGDAAGTQRGAGRGVRIGLVGKQMNSRSRQARSGS